MELSLIIMQKIAVMFALVAIGYICARIGMIDEHTGKNISSISLRLVTPMLIFASYQSVSEERIIRNLFLSFLLVFVAFAVQIPLAHLLIRKKENPNYQTERMSLIFANCGFFGIPLIESLYGPEGAVYITAYVTVFNILLWSVGTVIMTGKFSLRGFLKSLVSPAVVATVLGVGCLLLQIRVPDMIMEPVRYVANMNTPLAMLVAGATLSRTKLFPMLKNPRVYLVLLSKMLVIPAAAAVVLSLIPLENFLVMVPILATACPTGAVCTMFAVMYDKNGPYASQLFAITTLSSIVTIPLIFLLAGVLV